jgi:hypothetical protein
MANPNITAITTGQTERGRFSGWCGREGIGGGRSLEGTWQRGSWFETAAFDNLLAEM